MQQLIEMRSEVLPKGKSATLRGTHLIDAAPIAITVEKEAIMRLSHFALTYRKAVFDLDQIISDETRHIDAQMVCDGFKLPYRGKNIATLPRATAPLATVTCAWVKGVGIVGMG
ncbi:MAG: hypothetical protein KU37_07500 [Sulfuricurvum sp. PC08-66]|nr:MAG: hypothetical protein KU37_07500 [Sulfuricurvum sp. PC08-66]